MTTVDTLLLEIINHHNDYIRLQLAKRDYDILNNLYASINGHFFITENQSRLLLKILRENQEKLPELETRIKEVITEPTWSRKFRQIEQIKKLYVNNDDYQNPVLTVDFTFSSQIRKVLNEVAKKCDNWSSAPNNKKCWTDYTEKNIITLVDALTPLKFDIEETIKNQYDTIKSWSKSEVENQFLLTNIEHRNFITAITNDLGVNTSINQNIINDRSIRYQYFTENPKNFGENLTEIIANRSKPKIWIGKEEYNLSSIIRSLVELKRLPLLVVFDNVVNDKYLKNLEFLNDALEENGIFDGVGVYFRLPNDNVGQQFNNLIKSKSYNTQLDETTNVAVVMSGKIPKFFLKNHWKPMSVIALDTKMGLRHGKTAVYSNCCDLVVEWTDKEVLFENKAVGKWR
jgi:hypothetical protein